MRTATPDETAQIESQDIVDCINRWTRKRWPCTDAQVDLSHITKTRLFKYTENCTTKKWEYSDKNSDIFHISAQNIDCGHSLEPPLRGVSNEYPRSMFLSRNKKNDV